MCGDLQTFPSFACTESQKELQKVCCTMRTYTKNAALMAHEALPGTTDITSLKAESFKVLCLVLF